jgi:formate dehydrogenase subunit gamma
MAMQQSAPAPSDEDILAVVSGHVGLEGPLLPILHALQQAFGFIPQASLSIIARALNISRAEVHGVVSFYHDFRETPAGRHVVRICRAEACQASGANALVTATTQRLGIPLHATTPDGAVTLEPVYCLGLCACGPAVMIDDKLHGRVDAARLARLLEAAGS